MLKKIKMNKIKAIIFDFDGTLVDSEYFHFNCWNETLKEYNIKLQYEYYLNHYAGIPTPLNSKTIIEKYNLSVSLKDLSDQKERITESKLKTEDIKFMPNALDALEYFTKMDIPMFLVTGSPRNDVDFILEKTKIKKYFEFSITRSDVEKSKPNPESYLTAIKKSLFKPENILVFEDTKSGIESAKSANLKCFAIQKNIELQKKLVEADKIFENFNLAINFLVKENLLQKKSAGNTGL